MKNDYCKLSREQIHALPDRFKGFLLSPFQFNLRNEFVGVPEDTFQEMIEIIAEYAGHAARAAQPAPIPAQAEDAFAVALKQTWQMVDPYTRAVPGSYEKGRQQGLADALRQIKANYALATPCAGNALTEEAKDAALPTLPNYLLNLIGEYGMARTDGVNELEITHRWQEVICGIKKYTLSAIASHIKAGQAGKEGT